jgi:hypothetical protein
MDFETFKTQFEQASSEHFSGLFWPIVDKKRSEIGNAEAEFDIDDFTDEEGGTLKANTIANEIVESSDSEAELIEKIGGLDSVSLIYCIVEPINCISGYDGDNCPIIAACVDRMKQITGFG